MNKITFLIITCTLLFLSCSNEPDGINIPEDIIDPDSVIIDTCAFNLTDFPSNSTIGINCNLDLNGEIINLAENITLQYEGGSIINGTLNFNSGKIDGELLNKDLNITGETILSSSNFVFSPEKWNVLQGKVTIEEAIENKDNLNKIIALTKSLGADVFTIDEFDAYFYGDFLSTDPENSYDNAIQIPSDFHFRMSPNTFLRSQPSNHFAPRIIGIYKGNNIIVSGGNLIGDRYEHDYSTTEDWLGVDRSNHENGTVLFIAGGNDISIDNVTIKAGTGDAIGVGGSTIRDKDGIIRPDEVTATNIIISDCNLSDCRRNIISVIDCNGILIENNTIFEAGGERDGYPEAAGTDPQYGIDLEAYRERDENDNLLEYEKVENVIIRGNVFTDNYKGDIVIFTANDVLIEQNTMDNIIGSLAAFNCTIMNNTLIARDDIPTKIGISLNEVLRNNEHLSYNNTIANNYIEGYNSSIVLGGLNVTAKENDLNDFSEGISFRNLTDAAISDNTMTSERLISWGYLTIHGNVKNVTVNNDIVNVNHKTVNFLGLNSGITDGSLTFDSVDFNSANNRSLYLEDCNNITIQNSTITFGIENINSTNIESINNSID